MPCTKCAWSPASISDSKFCTLVTVGHQMQDALTHKRQKASLPPVTEVSGLNTMLKKLGLRAQNLQEEIYQILEGDVNFSKAGAVTGHLGGGWQPHRTRQRRERGQRICWGGAPCERRCSRSVRGPHAHPILAVQVQLAPLFSVPHSSGRYSPGDQNLPRDAFD